MWVDFESCDMEELVGKKSGKKYTAYAFRGNKRGYNGAPDEPYVKPVFENSVVSIKEKGIWRHGISIVQYLQKGVQKGDMLELKFDRRVTPPELISIENKSTNIPTYEPLSDAEVTQQQSVMAVTPSDYSPMTTQAPAPGMAQYAPAQNAPAPMPGQYGAIPF